MPKNQCLLTMVLEKTAETHLDSKEIKPVNLKEDQLWIFTGRTDVEGEAPEFRSSDADRWLIGKVPDARKDQGWKEKRASEDEMAGCTSPMPWTWSWANSGRWWGTGRPGVLQSMASQRDEHDWMTEQQQWHCHMLMSRRNILVKGKGFLGVGPLPTFWPFMFSPGIIIA